LDPARSQSFVDRNSQDVRGEEHDEGDGCGPVIVPPSGNGDRGQSGKADGQDRRCLEVPHDQAGGGGVTMRDPSRGPSVVGGAFFSRGSAEVFFWSAECSGLGGVFLSSMSAPSVNNGHADLITRPNGGEAAERSGKSEEQG